MISTSEKTVGSRVRELGPWFHDLNLNGVRTAPNHPLGDFLRELWSLTAPAFPENMTGKTVLDIGCNAGFYSLQLAQRGAQVTGMDHDPKYLEQARFAAEVVGADIEYVHLDVYDVNRLGRQFDFVLFMGVLYHLKHPLLALERVASVVRQRLVFQSMQRGSTEVFGVDEDYGFQERKIFQEEGFPAMYFVEHRYAGDPTNWWIPNRAAVEAMLRSSGLKIEQRVGEEIYYCSPTTPAGVA